MPTGPPGRKQSQLAMTNETFCMKWIGIFLFYSTYLDLGYKLTGGFPYIGQVADGGIRLHAVK